MVLMRSVTVLWHRLGRKSRVFPKGREHPTDPCLTRHHHFVRLINLLAGAQAPPPTVALPGERRRGSSRTSHGQCNTTQ
ncbi:unnamed protein product [Lota lota]